MKKTILVIAIGAFLASCNNSGTVADKKDSVDSITKEKKESIDESSKAAKDTLQKEADSLKKNMDSTAH